MQNWGFAGCAWTPTASCSSTRTLRAFCWLCLLCSFSALSHPLAADTCAAMLLHNSDSNTRSCLRMHGAAAQVATRAAAHAAGFPAAAAVAAAAAAAAARAAAATAATSMRRRVLA